MPADDPHVRTWLTQFGAWDRHGCCAIDTMTLNGDTSRCSYSSMFIADEFRARNVFSLVCGPDTHCRVARPFRFGVHTVNTWTCPTLPLPLLSYRGPRTTPHSTCKSRTLRCVHFILLRDLLPPAMDLRLEHKSRHKTPLGLDNQTAKPIRPDISRMNLISLERHM